MTLRTRLSKHTTWLRATRRPLVVGAATLVVAAPLAWAAHDYTDVPDANPFHGDIGALKRAGITSGKTCTPPGTAPTYCPEEGISREAMAAFIHRGLSRVAWAHDLYGVVPINTVPQPGQAELQRVTVGTVTIVVPGVSGGTQFVALHGKLSLWTNTLPQLYCPGAICTWHIDLVDDADPMKVLDDALWVPTGSSSYTGDTLSLDAVAPAPTASTKSYSLRIYYTGPLVEATFLVENFSLVAETHAFGWTGEDSIPPRARP